jgi:uncharacterized protein (TIGR02266 family)
MKGTVHRREPRVPAALKVNYSEPGDRHHETFTTHIGGGGCFIICNVPPSEGTPLHLEFTLPTSPKSIHVGAKVAWRRTEYHDKRPAGIGVTFHNLSQSDKEALRHFIDAALSRKI